MADFSLITLIYINMTITTSNYYMPSSVFFVLIIILAFLTAIYLFVGLVNIINYLKLSLICLVENWLKNSSWCKEKLNENMKNICKNILIIISTIIIIFFLIYIIHIFYLNIINISNYIVKTIVFVLSLPLNLPTLCLQSFKNFLIIVYKCLFVQIKCDQTRDNNDNNNDNNNNNDNTYNYDNFNQNNVNNDNVKSDLNQKTINLLKKILDKTLNGNVQDLVDLYNKLDEKSKLLFWYLIKQIKFNKEDYWNTTVFLIRQLAVYYTQNKLGDLNRVLIDSLEMNRLFKQLVLKGVISEEEINELSANILNVDFNDQDNLYSKLNNLQKKELFSKLLRKIFNLLDNQENTANNEILKGILDDLGINQSMEKVLDEVSCTSFSQFLFIILKKWLNSDNTTLLGSIKLILLQKTGDVIFKYVGKKLSELIKKKITK